MKRMMDHPEKFENKVRCAGVPLSSDVLAACTLETPRYSGAQACLGERVW